MSEARGSRHVLQSSPLAHLAPSPRSLHLAGGRGMGEARGVPWDFTSLGHSAGPSWQGQKNPIFKYVSIYSPKGELFVPGLVQSRQLCAFAV